MKPLNEQTCTAFAGSTIFAAGRMVDVALAAKLHLDATHEASILIFDDLTGQQIEFDFRGTEAEFLERLRAETSADLKSENIKAGPGRPKLGVVSREIGLLPRHWEWLARQPGGASAVMRKLVEDAQKKNAAKDEFRNAQDAAYRFMTIMAGNFPHFEEALRGLYAKNLTEFSKHVAQWPKDIREHALKLAKPAL